jgi:peroxiredoxin
MSAVEQVRAFYREKKWFRWAVEGFLALGLVTAVSAYQTRGNLKSVPLPPLHLTALDGTVVSVDSFKGKSTLLYVWAPWCGVCATQKSTIETVHKWVSPGSNVISLATSFDSVESVKQKALGLETPLLLDERADSDLHVTGFPTLYFVDAKGVIQNSAVGYTTSVGILFRLWML